MVSGLLSLALSSPAQNDTLPVLGDSLPAKKQVAPDTIKSKTIPLPTKPKPKAPLAWLPLDTSWKVPQLSPAELSGRMNYNKSKAFVQLPKSLTDGTKSYYLRIPAARALEKMILAASKDGVKLRVVSATRNFNEQKRIWENKWQGKGPRSVPYDTISNPLQKALAITSFSSMPGTSRHHWGTDIDLNSVEPSYFDRGYGAKTYIWLKKNAPKYGFCQVYKGKASGRSGYQDESWHWSYLPLARPFLDQYSRKVPSSQIVHGFSGAEVLNGPVVLSQYIWGIAPDCK